MSKLYKKYIELRSHPSHKENTLYLFKSGLFFIFIDKDAKIVSNYLNLKLGQLNDSIVKCGFPSNSLQKYLNLLKNTPYQVEMVSLDDGKTYSCDCYLYSESVKDMLAEVQNTNIDSLSISQAYDLLYHIQDTLKELCLNETNQ